jgi:hypothetical protein
VVEVQVGAHDHVDVLGREAGAAEVAEVVGVELVDVGQQLAVLVVAAAGVDQDRLAVELDHPRVDREGHEAGLGIGVDFVGWSYQPSRRFMSSAVVPGSWLSSGTGLSISCTLWIRMRPSSIGFIALSRRLF